MITIGSSDTRPFKRFQIRWAERLGNQDCPYLVRWTFLFFDYSVRIHHWIKSDDNRFFHDHSANLLSIVLYGRYWNVKPYDVNKNPDEDVEVDGKIIKNSKFCYVEGIFNSLSNFLHMNKSIWFSRAEDRHYLKIPKGGAWTLMFESRKRIKWGFYVNGKRMRPRKYFKHYGIRQDENYQ